MQVVKQFKFELAHRLVSSYSKKCQSIHGHSYIAEVILEDEHLNEDGMLIDFGKVKNKLSHLFEAWDHSFMFNTKDVLADHYKAMLRVVPMRMIEVEYNPTAENMAYHIFRACVENGLPIKEVRVQETLTGWAIASRPKPFVGENVMYYNIPEIEAQAGGAKRSYPCSNL
jgi:6-pyruvoyltetrahydropterin/6-carboxytetrahydropterin synthase